MKNVLILFVMIALTMGGCVSRAYVNRVPPRYNNGYNNQYGRGYGRYDRDHRYDDRRDRDDRGYDRDRRYNDRDRY